MNNNNNSKNFYRRLRHFEHANWLVLTYSFKSLMCHIKGDVLGDGFIRIDGLASSKSIETLPLTIISYDYCIEFAKRIRKCVLQNSADPISFSFTCSELFGIIIELDSSIEDCFYMVSETCGFDVMVNEDHSIYTITSTY